MAFDENAPIQLNRFPLPPGSQPKMKHARSISHLTGSIRGPPLRPSSAFDPNVSISSVGDVSMLTSVLDKSALTASAENQRDNLEMVDATLADLKAEIAILKSIAAEDVPASVTSAFAPSHKHHPTASTSVTTTPAKPKCAAHSAVDSPPVPALQARLKLQSVSLAEGLEGALRDDAKDAVLSRSVGSVEELTEDMVKKENEGATLVELTTTAAQVETESSSNKLSDLEQKLLEQNHLITALQNKIAEVAIQQQQQQQQKPAPLPIPSHDHESEIDFARLFARTIGDKERLQSENAVLLAENSRLKNRLEELEVASMLHVQSGDTPSKYYTPMSTPEASSRVVHIEYKHLTSLHRKTSTRKASSDRFLPAPQLPPIAPASPFVMRQ